MPWPRALATATVPLAAAVLAVGAAGLVVSAPTADVAWFAVAMLAATPSVVLGLVVARRQPRNPVSPLLAAVGLVSAADAAGDVYGAAAAVRPDLLPVWDVLVSLTAGGWIWLYVPVGLLALVFPDGRLPGRRWRVVAVGLPLVAVVFCLLVAVSPAPYDPPYEDAPHVLGTLPAWSTYAGIALLPLFLGLLVASAVSLRVRYRRADEVGRAQLKWFMLAGLAVPGTLLLCWASYLLLDGPDLVVVGLLVTYLAVPAATGIAMLRHDLYDVDRVISTAVTYALVTAVLLGVFTVVSFVGGVTLGAGSGSPVVAAAATAGCALALHPLRRRVQGGMARRLYPLRQGTLAAVDDLRRRVHAGGARPEQLEDVLRAGLRDPGLRVGYRAPGSAELVDAEGAAQPGDGHDGIPVRLGGSQIGVLLLGRPCPRPLAGEVADACALLVEVVRLRLELGRALADVEASRARLLHAGYAERRRLEQDLHDGAQQRLVSLGMALRLAQRHLPDGTVDVSGLLDATVAELATSVAELRQLAHGLRPSSLDDGLGAALSHLASTVIGRLDGAVPVAVDVDPYVGAGALPDDVATTAYYVASEAMANAVKHAQARRIDLRVGRCDGTVQVRVTDDGRGGAAVRPGSGLAGLGDRVAALGGSLVVSSPPSGGTVLEAVLPCAS